MFHNCDVPIKKWGFDAFSLSAYSEIIRQIALLLDVFIIEVNVLNYLKKILKM